ncbi:hypothetical protein NL676_008601 [Syzygium grande]|nr:hypothetical protein NL676_008601 [Syzygium grande]
MTTAMATSVVTRLLEEGMVAGTRERASWGGEGGARSEAATASSKQLRVLGRQASVGREKPVENRGRGQQGQPHRNKCSDGGAAEARSVCGDPRWRWTRRTAAPTILANSFSAKEGDKRERDDLDRNGGGDNSGDGGG